MKSLRSSKVDNDSFANLMQIVEGLLFIYGDDGLSLNDLLTALPEAKPSTIRQVLDALDNKYASDASTAFSIQRYGNNKLRLQTKKTIYAPLAKLVNWQTSNKLTSSAIEVLAIIAYQGPLTKFEIDTLRQTDSAYQILKLRERRLIRTVGKKAGQRANLYSITDNFFKVFNLKDDVMTLPEITENSLKTEMKEKNNHNGDLFKLELE